MPFYPFHSTFTELRTLELPANLAADARGRLVAKITAAVRQQAELAQKCDGLLRLTGEVREDGNYLLIPHEPAAPADPELIASRDDHPDIQTLWWLTWATLRALGAATADRAPHGSIQLGSLFMDQAGRVKLSDLGIGPAFESACGIDARRYVACDAHVETDAAGRASSGRWMVLSEEDARDHGWIAPFFAHELLEGQVRLNPKSDQFALGTLLFLCATGEHPYGAALSDPGLMFYFHIEPFALDDERAEWRESFKRKSKGLAQSSDRPVLAWAELVHKLLAAEPGERFASPAEASEFIQEHVPEEWAAASKAIDEANAALDGGDPDAFLDKLTPWPTHEALPEMWRTQLAARVEEVRAQKDVIGQQKLLARSLTEAQEALNDLNLDEARRVAQEILAAAHCPDTLRREADEIVKHCDEREKFVESGTDELAQHYLSAAREALQASEFNDARQYCEVILKDPGMSQTRTAQARQFIGEVELAEQRVKAQFDELEQATNELRKGHCEPAQERLEALLGDQSLPEAVATQVRLVLEDARRTLALRQEYTQALDDAQEAWQRGDLEVLRTRLESVPEDLSDAQISERRTTLLASAECLQTARQLQEEAHAAVDAGRCQAALATIEQAGAAGELPTVVREELAALQQRCREGLEQELRAARERAQTALQEARARYEAEDGVGCRKLLEQTVLPTEGLPDEARAEATALREACQLLEQAAAAAAEIEQHLARANVGRALALLRDLQTDGLPARLVTRLGQQRERAEHVRQQVEQAQRAQLDQRLKQAAAVIQKGQLEQAEAILAEVEAANGVSAEQRERASAMRAEVAKYRPLAETLAKAESVLAEAADTKRALALLERLPVEPPAWARPRADAIRQRATELEEQQRRETIARAAAALDATQSALEAGDAETARQRLDQTSAGIALEPSLTERRAALATALATLEQWLPKVAELDAAYQRSETARVYRDASTLLKDKSVPELVAKRLGTLQTAARKQIEARRKELAAELETLATELEQRGRRARQFEQRVELVRGDSLAAKDQISTADELRQRFAALPVPKSKAMPIGVAAAIVVVVGGAAAWFLTRNDDGHQPGPTIPTVVQDDRERMTAALASLQNRVDEAATELGAAAPRYTLRFEPADKLPAELLAQNTADGTDMSLGTIAVSDLASLSLTAAWHSQLFPPPPDTAHADDGARMGPVLARLQAAVNAAAAQAGPAAPSYTLRFDPADMLPARLIAQNAMDGTDLLLETVSAETLDTLGVSDAWRAQLFGPPPGPDIAALIAEAQARVQGDIRRAAAEEQQAGRSPGDFTARFEPQAELPTALIIQETDGDSVTLTTVTSAEQLTNLILTSAWRNRLFPPPADFANAVAAYLAELKTLLPGATFDDPSPPAANGAVTVQGSWKERALLPATNLRFHTQTGQLTPSAADVAPHFKSQIDALTAVSAAPDITVQLDRTYDAAVALIDSDSAARPISIDPDTDNVSITLPARLRDDPRPKASFQLSGALSERTLTGDAAARSAFAAYLKLLQQHQSTAGAQAARQALAIPAKLVAVLPTGFEGGNELALSVSDAAQHAIATIPLSWDVAQLTYVLSDQDAALTSIRAGVQKLLDVPSERRRLTQQLPAVLAAAGPAAPQTGAAYFTSCELVAFKPATDQPDDVFALAVEGEIGPPQSPQTEHLSLTLRLGFVDGLLSWDSEATAPAKLAVAEQLRALAGDAEFRKRRQDDVLQSLATSLKKPATELPPKVQDDALVVEVRGDDGRLTRYAAQWNNSTLRYDEPTAEVVAALSPAAAAEAKLADLTAGGGVAQLTADVFIDAFRDVTGAKIARCGQEAYQPLASLLDDGAAATARLAAVSTMLQDLIAPDRTKHPFPVVFVEYFLGPQDVYGLAWRAVTDDAGRITSATEPKIWRIMSTERLRQFGTPAVFRQAYSTDADLGEALLGQALGAALEGSDNNSYGVVLAPDGMLWYVYWEQVKFQSRPVSKLDGQGALVPTTATSLRDILKPGHKGSRPAWRRAGMWCVPTLAGQWQGGGRKRLNLGQLLPGQDDETASFRTTNDMLQCIIEDKSERSDLSWGELALRLRREDIGYLFWDRHWNGDRCNPTRIANFSLIPVKAE